jgi:hypothetical protein
MKFLRNSVTPTVMIVTAVFGWIIILVGLIGIWSLYPGVSGTISNGIGLANRSLDTSIQLLDGVDATLKSASDAISQIQTGLIDVSNTFGKTSPLFDSASNLVSTDFSKMADDTLLALLSLANTAKVIDDSLRFISSFPLIGQPYNPPVPLDTSINNLASSIEKLPANLNAIQSWLDGTGKDLASLKDDTAQLAASIDKTAPQLNSAIQVMAQYRQLVKDLKNDLAGLETRLLQGLLILCIALSIFLIWTAMTQVPNFVQAVDRLQSMQTKKVVTPQENIAIDDDDILEIEEIPSDEK